MLTKLLDAFLGTEHEDMAGKARSLQVITAAMLYNVARVDSKIDEAELERIRSFIDTTFEMTESELASCLVEAEDLAEQSTSLYELTSKLNKALDADDRYRIILNMWRVAYADGSLDKYEEQVIRRSAELLYVQHGDFIRARHEAGG